MPNRILKDSVNESRGLSNCSFFAQDLYKRLITYADDYGRFNADPQIMLARLYPRELKEVSEEDVIEALVELVGVEKIGFYTHEAHKDEVFGAFPNWGEHQRVRDSKHKFPDPSDTGINDWYLRRFISIDMKAAIIERDEFKCALCGKQIADGIEAKKLIKMGSGLFHIDHIVPVVQGGRATEENLRLTCPSCNLSRKKMYSFSEILQFAENGGELRRTAAKEKKLQPNPIQSESNPNPNPNPIGGWFDRFWAAYPRHVNKQGSMRAFEKLKPTEELLEKMIEAIGKQIESEQWTKDNGQYIPHPQTWLNGKRWEDELPRAKMRVLPSQDFNQRDYSGVNDELASALAKEMAAFNAGQEVKA